MTPYGIAGLLFRLKAYLGGKPGRPQYAEGILSSWKKSKVSTLEEVKRLDARHRSSQKPLAPAKSGRTQTASRFNNFHQREYDYGQLEKQLFERQLAD